MLTFSHCPLEPGPARFGMVDSDFLVKAVLQHVVKFAITANVRVRLLATEQASDVARFYEECFFGRVSFHFSTRRLESISSILHFSELGNPNV